MVKGNKKGGPRAPAGRPVSAHQLFEQAQIALQYDDFDTARTCLKRAAKLEPSNIEVVDALGALLAEIGPEKEAILVLKHAVQLSPNQGFEKFMYLGQLSEDAEAISWTRQGVTVLQAAVTEATTNQLPEAADLSRALCSALCSLAEMVMNGAEDVVSVAGELQRMLAQATSMDPRSPEPGQALASLHYEQGRAEEALAALRQSMALWFQPHSDDEDDEDEEADAGAGAGPSGVAMDEDDEEGAEEDEGPSYEFRVECAKLLLELEDSTDTAIEVLEGLIEEDDTNPDAWHLLGLAYYSGHQYPQALEAVGKGQALLATLGMGPEEEIVSLFEELHAAIREGMQVEGQVEAPAS